MKLCTFLRGILLVLLWPTLSNAQSLDGTWMGTLKTNGFDLEVYLKFKSKSLSSNAAVVSYTCRIDVPMQRLKNHPASSTEIKGKKLLIAFQEFDAELKGKLSDTNKIEGIWKQGSRSLPLQLTKLWGNWDVPKPQTPVAPYPYRSQQVSFSDAEGMIRFGGTFTIPDSTKFKAPYPTVILFTGSGTQDRDETIGKHKPFAVIAHALTQQGYSVLRIDDRGIGATATNPSKLKYTTQDLIEDGILFVDFAKKQPWVQTQQIFLMGHSEGGSVALGVGIAKPEIAGIIGLAPMVASGLETNIYQNKWSLLKQGMDSATFEVYAKLHRKIVFKGLSLPDSLPYSAFESQLPQLIEEWEHEIPSKLVKKVKSIFKKISKEPFQEVLAETFEPLIEQPWFRQFLTLDLCKDMAKLNRNIPYTVIQGSLDKQIEANASRRLIQEMNAKGYTELTYKEFAGLNHLLQHCKTGDVGEYFSNSETISPEVLNAIIQTLNGWQK